MLQSVNYSDSFFHAEHTGKFKPGFNWTNKFEYRHYLERHNITKLLWARFLCKLFSESSSEIFPIIILQYFLGHILKVFNHSCFLFILRTPNIEVVKKSAYDFVSNTMFTTLNFVCTYTVYFRSLVVVPVSIDVFFYAKRFLSLRTK